MLFHGKSICTVLPRKKDLTIDPPTLVVLVPRSAIILPDRVLDP